MNDKAKPDNDNVREELLQTVLWSKTGNSISVKLVEGHAVSLHFNSYTLLA